MLLEFCGTPSSGKSSVIERLKKNDRYADVKLIDESAINCPYNDSNLLLSIIWTIIETYLITDEIIKGRDVNKDTIIIFDRGIIDRIAFARLLSHLDAAYRQLADIIVRMLYEQCAYRQFDHVFLFLTSFTKSYERKLQYKFRAESKLKIVNHDVINALNDIYRDLYQELKDEVDITIVDDLSEDLDINEKTRIIEAFLNDR